MRHKLSRRRLFGLAAVAVGGAVNLSTSGCGLVSTGEPGTLLRSTIPIPEPYQVPLPIPPVLQPSHTDATTDYYEITQQPAVAEIIPGYRTPLWTYQGTFPGPTLVSRSGRRTVVKHVNKLPHPVVVHLHGGHTPQDSDGYPGDMILPDGGHTDHLAHMGMMPALPGIPVVGSREYVYPFEQRAATLWYHDHRMGFTGQSVWYGLAGFHLVHDDEEDRLPLPCGDRDIPLLITDRAFDADGAMPYPSVHPDLHSPGVTPPYMNGVLGDVILVNGAPSPITRVQRLRYRLRLLNASNARRYRFELDPQPPGGGGIVQIGSDGGLLDRPRAHDSLQLASAERADVVIDFARYAPGTRVRLRNTLGTGRTTEVLAFDVSSHASVDDTMVPEQLSTMRLLDPATATVTRDFLFQNRGEEDGWMINGQPYDPARPLATPRLGEVERWRFITDVHHPVHLHLDHFQVLARDGEEPGPYDHGWKDTLGLEPAQAAEILVRFTDYPGRYMLHCHNLEHEDMAMMADYLVT
ncbi:multicopper oxidase family protein [Kibdelosporangium aridum]|uniref:Multicopper oxidase with three cupredoxin domains (Includes cell division protein FtsP and spore coat protein CotA) n=1 Tax=Kibdelosporangium aridum TaxID=2030 RepID=A0A1Y5Y6D6_KIBAR|nr:multicopper oxidase family protein [Kibdelosporangium aridum]SMD26424.1 Multicopper oxidase with three cupredoxin domains (includes cell division protein FtsP and spore coat protein CotA) [Kibdelosporangium aridum]